MTRDEAYRLRAIVEQASASLDDKTASEGVSLFPKLKQDGSLVRAGTRIRWGGMLKRAAVDLWDTTENTPDAAPTLWEDIAYREGYRVIPETITATLAFAMNEIGWWDGKIYKSLRDGNTFPPSITPEWWIEIE